jgi:hypothetical protein
MLTGRTTQTAVTFLHPFTLPGAEGEQAAGTYIVETLEEPIEGLTFLAYRRVSMTIVLPSAQYGWASRQVVTIDPRDLEAAKQRDTARAGRAA